MARARVGAVTGPPELSTPVLMTIEPPLPKLSGITNGLDRPLSGVT